MLQLHENTLKLWSTLAAWKTHKENLLARPFIQVDISEITDFIAETTLFLESKLASDPLFTSHLSSLSEEILKDVAEIQGSLQSVRGIGKKRKKHWHMMFQELGLPFNEDFTFSDLQRGGFLS